MTKPIGRYNRTLHKLPELLRSSSGAKIYVDFDYTLFRSSSTEEFLNAGRPAFMVSILLKLLSALHPWSIIQLGKGPQIWRDPVRTWVLLIFMPWTIWLFKKKSRKLFEELENTDLMSLLSDVESDRVVIVSLGYEWIIRQLLRNTPLSNSRIIGSSFIHPTALRRSGKLERLQELDIRPVYEVDVVVTDSEEDDDLLESVYNAFLIEPSIPERRHGVGRNFVPLEYTARVKRSPEFVVKQILLEELPVVLLATALFHSFAPHVWIGALLLFVAFLAVYEIGYAENDRLGYRTELRPKLHRDYDKFKNLSLQPDAWFWAVGLTVLGVLLLGPEITSATLNRTGLASTSAIADLLIVTLMWLLVVGFGRGVFFVFNRLATTWRIFAFLPLHLVKYFSLVIILPSQPAGYALLYAHIVRTWSLYAIRRCGGDLEFIASQSVRLVFFITFLVSLEIATPENLLVDWRTWVILAWCVVRAAPEARRKLFSRAGFRGGLRT